MQSGVTQKIWSEVAFLLYLGISTAPYLLDRRFYTLLTVVSFRRRKISKIAELEEGAPSIPLRAGGRTPWPPLYIADFWCWNSSQKNLLGRPLISREIENDFLGCGIRWVVTVTLVWSLTTDVSMWTRALAPLTGENACQQTGTLFLCEKGINFEKIRYALSSGINIWLWCRAFFLRKKYALSSGINIHCV